ncbi:hypothetical protein OROHE_021284 [Orobanche hederae]
MKSEKPEVHEKSIGVKRKKLTGHAFKSLLRKKRNSGIVPAVDDSENSRSNLAVREISNNSECVPTNCSPAKSEGAHEPENATCLRRSINPECVAGTTPRSEECENCSLLGICILCSKEKRVSYDSEEKELCTCNVAEKDLDRSSTCKDSVDQGSAVFLESAEKCHYSDRQMDDHGTVCAVCNNGGELMCCEGKDCRISYHLSCLDPCLADDLPGVRHCFKCVNNKLKFGVYFVSEGVESIWDFREVDVSNAKGIKQMQYLVKCHGLAHIHNHWVPEKQLVLKNKFLVSNYISKDKTVRWSVEWTLPHRLLRKRPILDKFHAASSADIFDRYEWLVKWHGQDYGHATWELDSSKFLSSSLGLDLVKDYEIRREKAKREVDKCQKGSFVELSELPVSGLDVNDNFLLKNVNKLRECWYKCQNTVVFYDQFATSDSLSQWEAEFARLAPSVDVVVYNGNIDTRKGIRASEFYEEGGCVMLQVLLSSREVVFEDLDMLSCIRWQSIVIDEYQPSGISVDLEQIKILTTDSRILLLSGQIKDTTSEYINILSLLDSEHEYNKLRGLRSGKNDNLAKLKERLSRFIAYGSTSEISKFIEYWVPVQISNHQLEQYCTTLISSSILLCSCSRNDKVGALRDILLTVRKCCDHPYLVDSSIQEHMIAEGRPLDEILDVGIKASGKLQLLDRMLTQVKARELKVLVLFQLVGSGGCSTRYILDDFLAQKFGANSYECIFAGASPAMKQAAIHRFNKKENGKFILLLENRACSSAIKLSSLDVIVLYNSDWNPANDFKALQKIATDLTTNQIKVFRLYSSCTVEERALVLAKKDLNLDNNLQASSSRSSSDSLLMWGAACLLSNLDDYHAQRYSNQINISGQLLLNEVTEEFESILSERGEISKRAPIISKVKLDVGSYSADVLMLGEAKVKLTDVEEPHIFWKDLLYKRNPQWKHLMDQCQRNRKRVYYLENDNTGNKRRSALIKTVYQASAPAERQETQVAFSEEGPSRTIATGSSQSSLRVRNTSLGSRDDMLGPSTLSWDGSSLHGLANSHPVATCSPEVDESGAEERNSSFDAKKSLNNSLQEETERLCQILKLSEDVTHTVKRFLECVILNHRIWRDSPAIMQAFQLSLLWVAASISKQEFDKTESLILAKQLLNYQCTEEQVHSVYSKMLDLKWKYLRSCPTTINLGGDCLLAETNAKKETCNIIEGNSPPSSSVQLLNVKMKIEENSTNEEHRDVLIDKDVWNATDRLNELQRKCDRRMKKLIQNQKREIQEVFQNWEVKKSKLEVDHNLASALIRSIYGEGSARTVKLKLLDGKFAKEMNNLLKDVQLKDLEAKHLSARNEEREKASHWMAKAKACCSSELGSVNSTFISRPSEEIGGIAPIETPSNFSSVYRPKLTGETISATLPASEERVSDETESVELNREVQPEVSGSVIVDNVNTEEMISSLDKWDMIGLPDALVNKSDAVDDKASCVLPVARQISEPSEQKEASLHRCVLLPLQEPDGKVHEGAHALEDQSTFQFEVAASEIVDSATIRHSTSELQDRGAPAPAVADHGTLQIEDTNSPNCVTVTPDAPALGVEDNGTLHIESTNSAQGGTATPDARTPGVEDHDTLHIDVIKLGHGGSVTPDAPAPAVEDHGTLQVEGITSLQSGNVTPDAPAHGVEDHGTLHTEGTNSVEGSTVTPDAATPALEDHCTLQIEGINSLQGGTVTPDAPAPGLYAHGVEDHDTLHIEGTNSTQGGTVTPDAPVPGVQDHDSLHIEGTNSTQGGTVIPDAPAPSGVENHGTLHIEGNNSGQGGTATPVAPTPAVEDHGTLQSEGINSQQGGSVTPDAPAPCSEDHDTLHIEGTNSAKGDNIAHLPTSVDAQAVENCEQLNHMSVDESPNETQSVAIGVENQCHNSERNSSRTTEAVETEMIQRESAPPAGAILEIQTNHLDIGSVHRHDHETNVVMTQAAAGTVEPPNQPVLQLGIDLGHEDTSWDSPYLFLELFHYQLENIRRETEQLEKNREETMLRLKSDFEKELKEIIDQVLKKYDLKLRDAEAEYISKKNGLDENHNKVLMNKILANAFSFICQDLQSSGLPGIQQDISSGLMQHSHHQILAPAPHLQAFRPAAPSLIPQHNSQQPLLSSQILLPPSQPPPVTSQNRPQHQGGPPPSWGTSLPALELLRTVPQHNSQQQLLSSQILLPPSQPPPVTSQNRPQYQGGPPPSWGTSLPALELLRTMDRGSHVPGVSYFFRFT